MTGRIWTYVRDDRPFGGHAPPAALYYASRDRKHEHPVQHLQAFTGILQADAYSGYNELYDPSRSQGAITAALCWAHARRQFFELADIAANARRGKKADGDLADRARGGQAASTRCSTSNAASTAKAPKSVCAYAGQIVRPFSRRWKHGSSSSSLVTRSASVAQPIDYMLRALGPVCPNSVEDGRVCLTNNAAERALRGFALGRKSWLFAGSERGADRGGGHDRDRLIMTAKLNDADPQAWLADVLARIADMPHSRIAELLPWNRNHPNLQMVA